MRTDPTDEQLWLKLLKKLMLVYIESCQNTKCIVVCCAWGWIDADQSGCPWWPLFATESGNNGHVSIRTRPWSNVGRCPCLMIHVFSFTSRTWLVVCTLLTWETHGTKMHYEKKVSQQRQSDASGNVLLENLGSCHPCGCYFDTHQLPQHCCRPCTPFHGNHIPWWLWPLSAGYCAMP